jgi:putative DNA primase/helicase
MWVGEADPLSNAEKVRENDPERERTAAILSALPAGRAWAVSEICRMLQQDRERGVDFRKHDGLSEALGEFVGQNGNLNTVRFGHFLRKNTGRIVDGKKIVNRGTDRNKIAQWAVEDVSISQFSKS